jgi:serine/threonine-protein kinase haspin
MPPKLYGKRTKAPAVAYAKFLSPDKENIPNGSAKQLQKQKLQPKQDTPDIIGLDQQLEALTLKEEETSITNKDVKTQANRQEKDQTRSEDQAVILVSATPTQNTKPKARRRIETTPQLGMPLLPTPEPTPAPDDIYSTYVAPVLQISDLRKVVPFEHWSSKLDPHFGVTKIAEASFSEVYRLTTKSGRLGLANESVLKVVALKSPPNAPLPSECETSNRARKVVDPERQAKRERADREKEDEWKSHVADVVSEVKLLQNLNHIPGFTHFCEVTVLQGRPSELFAKAWKSWNKSRPRGKKSEFPDPNKRSSYEDAQLWVVIEMQDAGTDCEKMMEAGGVGTVWEIWDVFWGVCLSVAKAEEACRFEHRDLHLENICIRSAQPGMDPMEPIIRNPLKRKLGFSGLETTVIDYTLSRADIVGSSKDDSRRTSSSSNSSFVSALSTSTIANSPNGAEVAYLDLNKSVGLFDGNAEDEYQYEIYRYMRGAVFHNNPLWQAQDYRDERPSTPVEYSPETPRRSPRKAQIIETPGSVSLRNTSGPSTTKPTNKPDEDIWKRFHPKTNLVWAHFILYKLLEHMEGYEPANLSLEDIMVRVKVSPEDAPKVQKKAIRLYRVLEKVNQMLEPSELGKEGSLASMKDLVVMAIEHRWLGVGDVAGEEVDGAY